MRYAIQWIRSLVFICMVYISMLVVGVMFMPFAVFSRKWAYHTVHVYCRWVRLLAHWMVGLRSEVRGTVPTGEVLIASKHQSFFDVLILVSVVPKPKFIMKASLRFAPILGWYGKRLGCVPVHRGKRTEAMRDMIAAVTDGSAPAGQLIIYPQGTRVNPEVYKPYKVGTAALYAETGQTCVPVATNVGVFWRRHGIYRKPGLAVIEFLEPIAPGLDQGDFMDKLQDVVESRSIELMGEAGYDVSQIPRKPE